MLEVIRDFVRHMTIPVRIERKPQVDHDRQEDRPGLLDGFSKAAIVVIMITEIETALG